MIRLCFILVLVWHSTVVLQASTTEENKKSWCATLYGGLYVNNKQAWHLEPSVSWRFHKYIGVCAGLEITSQYNQPGHQTIINGLTGYLSPNDANVAWIIFKPGVIFYSPYLWNDTRRDYKLWIQASPGISLGSPIRNYLTYEVFDHEIQGVKYATYKTFQNKYLQWVFWQARASVNFAIDRMILGAGYAISNLDYYSGRRNVTLQTGQKFLVPNKSLSQSFFLSFGYSF